MKRFFVSKSAFQRRIKVHSYSKDKDRMCVFQMHPNIEISLDEVRSAFELRKNDNIEYYAVFGIDGDMAERYLPVVEQLERSYAKSLCKDAIWGNIISSPCKLHDDDNGTH
jgi:hypothetical protein